jgi:PIN domain
MAEESRHRDAEYVALDSWHAVLDTNGLTLRGTQGDFDFWVADPEMRRLVESAPRQIFRLCVPDIVVREMANHFRERLQESARSLGSALSNVGRLLDRTLERGVSAEEVALAIETFEVRFRQSLAALDIHVEPLPPMLAGVEIVLQRDLQRRKPFGERSGGMRDALIWESVLELCRREPRSLAFITGNTQDFADDSKVRLHPDLLADFETVRSERQEVRLYRSIKEFNDAHLTRSEADSPGADIHSQDEARAPVPPVNDTSE